MSTLAGGAEVERSAKTRREDTGVYEEPLVLLASIQNKVLTEFRLTEEREH